MNIYAKILNKILANQIQKIKKELYTTTKWDLSQVYKADSTCKNQPVWDFPVAQWLGICLPMQGTRVGALVQEDPTCHRAAKPVRHNCWACALEPASHNYWAHVPQLLKLACLEPVLHNKRSHCNEKPLHHGKEWPPLTATREKPTRRSKDPTQPKINKLIN